MNNNYVLKLVVFISLVLGVFISTIYIYNFYTVDSLVESSQTNDNRIVEKGSSDFIVDTDVTPQPQEVTKQSSQAAIVNSIIQSVPFTSQAPNADWNDPRQQNGCEEAVALMAVSWAQDKDFTLVEAEEQIIAISEFQEENYNHFHDSSAQDTLDRIIKGFLGHDDAEIRFDIGTSDVKNELASGNVVIVPVDGRLLQNPYFTPPGPTTHMILVIGFDQDSEEFIVHDPGTKRGRETRYSEEIIALAMKDYPSGYHLPNEDIKTAMIVVKSI